MYTYDGDTPQDARRAVRARANLVLTNPDMLHSGILPHHTKWANALPEPPLRGDRRAARLPRRVRQRTSPTCCAGSSASAVTTARRRSSSWRRRPSPTRASSPSASPARRSSEITESGAPDGREARSSATTRPSSIPSWASARPYLGEAARLAIRFLKREDRRPSSSPRAGSPPRCCCHHQARRRGQDG